VIINGWKILFHEAAAHQILRLSDAVNRARQADPETVRSNANTVVLRAVAQIVMQVLPAVPGSERHRQGNTLGPDQRHWFRVKFLRNRYRLFYRFDGKTKIIIIGWLNDENSLRKSGAKTDAYEEFKRRLRAGHPPDDWADLMAGSADLPPAIERALQKLNTVGTIDEG
jgi:toxin YhaV